MPTSLWNQATSFTSLNAWFASDHEQRSTSGSYQAWLPAPGSQVEWIHDGLAQYGVRIKHPLDSSQVLDLLDLIGTRRTDKTKRVRWHIKNNAFRWLRDSGFDSMGYALTNATSLTSEKVRRGLEWYEKFSRSFRKEDGIGLLFSEADPPPVGASKPDRQLMLITVSAYSCMIIPLLAAFLLLRPLSNGPVDHVTGDA